MTKDVKCITGVWLSGCILQIAWHQPTTLHISVQLHTEMDYKINAECNWHYWTEASALNPVNHQLLSVAGFTLTLWHPNNSMKCNRHVVEQIFCGKSSLA